MTSMGRFTCDTLFKFYFTAKRWSTVLANGSSPSPRRGHVGVVYDDALYVFGGFNHVVQLHDFTKFTFRECSQVA